MGCAAHPRSAPGLCRNLHTAIRLLAAVSASLPRKRRAKSFHDRAGTVFGRTTVEHVLGLGPTAPPRLEEHSLMAPPPTPLLRSPRSSGASHLGAGGGGVGGRAAIPGGSAHAARHAPVGLGAHDAGPAPDRWSVPARHAPLGLATGHAGPTAGANASSHRPLRRSDPRPGPDLAFSPPAAILRSPVHSRRLLSWHRRNPVPSPGDVRRSLPGDVRQSRPRGARTSSLPCPAPAARLQTLVLPHTP